MNINKSDLFEQIKELVLNGESIYIGKLEEIKINDFDINNLYVASLFNFSVSLSSYKTTWNETALKYIFEKVEINNHYFFREIFSGAVFEWFDFKSLMKLRGMYLTEPMTYVDYVNSLTTQNSYKKIKTQK